MSQIEDRDLRIRCLELALSSSQDPERGYVYAKAEDVVARANTYETYVKGSSNASS